MLKRKTIERDEIPNGVHFSRVAGGDWFDPRLRAELGPDLEFASGFATDLAYYRQMLCEPRLTADPRTECGYSIRYNLWNVLRTN